MSLEDLDKINNQLEALTCNSVEEIDTYVSKKDEGTTGKQNQQPKKSKNN
jgi:hypothetical protein